MEEFEKEPSLRHLAQHIATCLASHNRLEHCGEPWGEGGQGLTQGDSEAGCEFCVGIHCLVKKLHHDLSEAGGLAIFGNDDGYALGPPASVFPAVQQFKEALQEHCSLTLQLDKCKVYHESGLMPPGAPPDMKRAGSLVNGEWCPGFLCYGVAIGSPTYVRNMLSEKVEVLKDEVDKVMGLLKNDNQAAWVLLSTSLSKQLDYSLTLQYPSDMLEPAAEMDARLWSAMEQVSGQYRIPRSAETGG